MENKTLAGAWPSDYLAQRDLMDEVKGFVRELYHMQAPVTIHKSSAPDNTDIEDAWHVEVGETSHTPLYGKFFWWNPDTEYVETVQTNIETSDGGAENYAHIEPIKDNGVIKFFDEIRVYDELNEVAEGSWTVANADSTYRHRAFLSIHADNYVGASHDWMEFSGVATGSYNHAGFSSDLVAGITTTYSVYNDAEWWPPARSAGAGTIASNEPCAVSASFGFIVSADVDTKPGGFATGALKNFTSRDAVGTFFSSLTAVAQTTTMEVTSIDVQGRGTNSRIPSRLAWWGIKGRP